MRLSNSGGWFDDVKIPLNAGLVSIIGQKGSGKSALAELMTLRDDHDQTDDNATRYLSQKFVEQLCADDHLGDELVKEIENVIFSYIDPSDTLNASSFEELRALHTDGTRALSGPVIIYRRGAILYCKRERSYACWPRRESRGA